VAQKLYQIMNRSHGTWKCPSRQMPMKPILPMVKIMPKIFSPLSSRQVFANLENN
jgi:hypothetical protein